MTPRLRFAVIVAIGAAAGGLLLGLLWSHQPLMPLAIATGIGSAIGAWLIWPWIEARQKRD